MHVAIDKDGTLSAYPEQFLELIRCLRQAGHQVTVLTGSTTSDPMTKLIGSIEQQLQGWGISRDLAVDLIICCGGTVQEVAREKGLYCRRHQVAMIFEDSLMYLAAVRELSPETVCFQILPVGGP